MIRVQADDFDPAAELEALTRGNAGIGGVCSFIGLVRDIADGERIGAMTLDHYPEMTRRRLEEIEAEAMRRWSLEGCTIIHRHGRLVPGDRIVFVATASAHRQAAFESAAFLMDWLKTKAPFWKLEETGDGERWVAARQSDDEAAARWTDDPAVRSERN